MDTIALLLEGRSAMTLLDTASALEAARVMADGRVGATLVVDAQGKPVGMFTERDLMTRVVVPRRDPAQTSLRDVMTVDLFFARPGDKIDEMAVELQRRHIRHLPVFENNRVVGLLSLRDLLRHNLKQRIREVENLTEYIQGVGELEA